MHKNPRYTYTYHFSYGTQNIYDSYRVTVIYSCFVSYFNTFKLFKNLLPFYLSMLSFSILKVLITQKFNLKMS